MIQPGRCLNVVMKRTITFIVLWSLLALGSAIAQEPDEPDEQETPAESEDSGDDDQVERATADEVFVPSERISADQEVIFPVDI